LLRIFREEWTEPLSGPRAVPAIAYRETGEGLATLMKASATPAPAAAPTGNDAPADDGSPAPTASDKAPVDGGVLPSLRVTGISDDLYAGWSLLATGQNLPRGQRIAITQPFLLEPDAAGVKRMLVVDIAEIGDPRAVARHFLLKAYAIDAESDAAGLRESFHVGAPLDNEEAKKTLAQPGLSSIEVARCLWHDFGTGQDPGLCR
jgi:hypothetical protein